MEVQCSTKYAQFLKLAGNRPVREDRVRRIAESMKRRGFIKSYHIVVNKRMEITDGQHRFEAAKSIGIPVYYVVDENLQLVDVQETGRMSATWKFMDYISAHAEAGNQNYVRIKECLSERNLLTSIASLVVCSAIYGVPDHNGFSEELHTGKITFTEECRAKYREICMKVDDFNAANPEWWTIGHAIRPTLRMILHPKYDHKRMLSKLRYQSTRLVRCAQEKDYRKMLTEIYNYRTGESNIVSFKR